METNLDISKGLHTDFEPINQPAGTYRHLRNSIRQTSGAIENEKGTIPTLTFNELDRKIIGSYVLDNDIILFSYAPSNTISEIGLLTAGNSYTVITNSTSLGFSLSNNIKAEGKKNFKGDRIIYFTDKGLPMRVLNIDAVPAVNFDDNTRLVLTADMPQISLKQVIDGGSLPTGMYQFGVRLLTKSTNSTSLSLLTNLIPIVDDNVSNRDKYDGAPPQTASSKAIVLNITNVDTDYEFIELVVITYIGTGNVTQASVISRVPIQNRTSIEFTYSSLSQIKEAVDINSVVVDSTNYDSAKFIIQKDGILILGGLTAEVSDYNFQAAANKVVIKYVIKEVNWSENINIVNGVDTGEGPSVGDDYKNPETSTNFKSYQRDEVYSFAVVPIFKNWSTGNAYHIPGKLILGSASSEMPASTITKELGTFWSTEEYPINKGYPGADNFFLGRRVRHHIMPSLAQEPHVRTVNGQTVIRMLGVSVDLTAMIADIPTVIKKNIIGYVVVKQKRTEENKSVLCQGVAHSHFTTAGPMPNLLYPTPFAGNSPMMTGQLEAYTTAFVGFYSPETIITKESMKNATLIRSVLKLNGTTKLVKDKRAGDDVKFAHVFLNYNDSVSTNSGDKELDTSVTQYVNAGAERDIAGVAKDGMTLFPVVGTGKTISTWRSPGYLLLKMSAGELYLDSTLYTSTTTPYGSYGNVSDVAYNARSGQTDLLYLNGIPDATSGVTSRLLFNLLKPNARQYGSVFDAKYHYVNHTINLVNPILECFNGDVFITKFAVMSSTNPYGGSFSVDLKGLSYFWVESSINCGYRHFKEVVGKEGDPNYEQGTLPYYPKVKLLTGADATNLGLFDYSPALGHPTGYNKQYSFENTIRSYFPTSIELEPVTEFPNRLIYSEQAVEGEQLDAFRIFLANNFHDIPKEKGKITNIFKLANSLYVHAERSSWKTYFNEQVTQASSAGEVYLGNGGVFSRPSTEIVTVKGGYGGTTSYSSSCTTPFGHLFIDEDQKKVFMFSDKLDEISDQGMFKYFKNNLLPKLADTPALNTGYTSSFDYENKRWLLTKIGAWTISYSTQLSSWSAFHDYLPYHYISVGDKLYSSKENVLYQNNVGVYGAYYGELPSFMQLTIVINDVPQETKTFDNLVFYTTSDKIGKEQHYDTFSTAHFYNNRQNTGKCRLIVPKTFDEEFIDLNTYEVFAKLKSNEFRVAIPSDLVIDVEGDIFGLSNLKDSRDFNSRMSGKFMIASLAYNNLRNNRFVLHNVGRLFRQRIR